MVQYLKKNAIVYYKWPLSSNFINVYNLFFLISKLYKNQRHLSYKYNRTIKKGQ